MRFPIIALILTVLFSSACARNRPPNLSPDATKAYTSGQVVNALDDVRDTATAFNSFNQRPFADVAVTRRVVQAHQSALVVIDARGQNWQAQAKNLLVELLKNLPEDASVKLRPYAALATVLIDTLSTREIDEVASAQAIAAYRALVASSLQVDKDWLAGH
jgi:hypothetical protein